MFSSFFPLPFSILCSLDKKYRFSSLSCYTFISIRLWPHPRHPGSQAKEQPPVATAKRERSRADQPVGRKLLLKKSGPGHIWSRFPWPSLRTIAWKCIIPGRGGVASGGRGKHLLQESLKRPPLSRTIWVERGGRADISSQQK